jgi:hypothetical protein
VTTIVISDGAGVPGIAGVVLSSVDTARFDEVNHSWRVQDADGRCVTARVLIDARPSAERVIATHGLPNYFRIPGPDVARQARFVNACLDLLDRSGSTRIEARSRIVLHRWLPRSVSGRFFFSDAAPDNDDLYEGPAVIEHSGRQIDVRARLTGHLEAIDGVYHWRGTVAGDLPDDLLKGRRAVELSISGQRSAARVVEQTPWGDYTVAGSGVPPYPRD